jgi:hypothetical protein
MNWKGAERKQSGKIVLYWKLPSGDEEMKQNNQSWQRFELNTFIFEQSVTLKSTRLVKSILILYFLLRQPVSYLLSF